MVKLPVRIRDSEERDQCLDLFHFVCAICISTTHTSRLSLEKCSVSLSRSIHSECVLITIIIIISNNIISIILLFFY